MLPLKYSSGSSGLGSPFTGRDSFHRQLCVLKMAFNQWVSLVSSKSRHGSHGMYRFRSHNRMHTQVIPSCLACSNVHCPRGANALFITWLPRLTLICSIFQELERDLVRLGTEVVTSLSLKGRPNRPFLTDPSSHS